MSAAPPLGGTVALQMSSHHGWMFEDYEGESCGPISLVTVHWPDLWKTSRTFAIVHTICNVNDLHALRQMVSM